MKPKDDELWWYVGGGLALGLGSWWAYRNLMPRQSGTYDFPFNDSRYIGAKTNGGRAYVPPGTLGRPGVLVWLHGNNTGGPLHRGLGAPGFDLRKLVGDRIVAAPSQTMNADGGKGLWAGFDLDAFIDAVEKAVGFPVDRSDIVVAGHSGAGCGVGAGIYAPWKDIVPSMVLAIDTCFDTKYGQLLGAMGEKTDVKAFYQRATWNRDFASAQRALGSRGTMQELRPTGGSGNPHEDIVPMALAIALK